MENLFSFLDKGVGALVLNGFDGEVLLWRLRMWTKEWS